MKPPFTPPIDPESIEIRKRLDWTDADLLKECEVETYRSSGPGGQKKNKTWSAVRLRHPLSGIVVIGTESRSQRENKLKALGRLREAIALEFRQPLPKKITWPDRVHIAQNKLKVNPSNPNYINVLALALDALEEVRGKAAEAAKRLEVTTSSYVKFLAENPKAWQKANAIRKDCGLSPLKSS